MEALLKIQIGPVQEFIAQSRSTRDLWSGSYLLSWLVAAGIRELERCGGSLVFPSTNGQPLLELKDPPESCPLPTGQKELLTPNLPNVFIARVIGNDPEAVARAVKAAIESEWKRIAAAVWEKRHEFALPDTGKARFDDQVDRHLSISWQLTGIANDGYAEAYKQNGRLLDAVRQTRDFTAWRTGDGMTEKDSLSGKEEALVGGTELQGMLARRDGPYPSLFAKHADYLGAVSIIKRCWHLAYLRDRRKFKTGSQEFRIRSIPAIAARKSTHDDDEAAQEKAAGENYIAAIAFDGDSIGKWVSGEYLPVDRSLEGHHEQFSAALSNFALKRVRAIIEELVDGKYESGLPTKVPLGQLIYAGGDDVVALVPADEALDVASKLRTAFQESTQTTPSKGEKPDASVGIAIAHVRSPLQDLIREAQKAEKRAKTVVGRPAFSITLMKRSGEISHWGSRWDNGGLKLYQAISKHLESGALTAKFPHRVCQLLTPYLTHKTGLSRLEDAINDGRTIRDLITREFAHAVHRQSGAESGKGLTEQLLPLLEEYLLSLRDDPQTALTSLIQLCTTVAFTRRIASDASPSAEVQPQP